MLHLDQSAAIMALTIRQRKKLKVTAKILFIGAILGLIFSSLSDGFDVLYPHVNSVICGMLVGLLIAYLEFFVFNKKSRRLQFMTIVAIRTGLYFILITAILFTVFLLSRVIRFKMGIGDVWASEEFQRFLWKEEFKVSIIYTVTLAFIINFTMLINRKMGQGVMLGFITGKYFHPKKIDRIFMFLSIQYSDQIIKNIGRLSFHKFLNDFFFDIAEPIIEHKGIIYEYVEDEIVVYWIPKDGEQNVNCLRTFFDAKKIIKEKSEKYYTKYGFVPQFDAGFHYGNVIQGEMGEIKSDVVFFGDVLNTASRIKNQCEPLDCDLIVSAQVKYRMDLPQIYKAETCGQIQLKGKKESLELFAIKEQDLTDISGI